MNTLASIDAEVERLCQMELTTRMSPMPGPITQTREELFSLAWALHEELAKIEMRQRLWTDVLARLLDEADAAAERAAETLSEADTCVEPDCEVRDELYACWDESLAAEEAAEAAANDYDSRPHED